MPVEGPPRCTSITTSGISAMMASRALRFEGDTGAAGAGYGDATGVAAPSAMEMAAISSSVWMNVPRIWAIRAEEFHDV